MLGYWRPHDNFQNWLVGKLQLLMPGLEPQILFHAKVLEKVYTLNLDPLKDLVANCYSPIGRPAQKQPELFRALVVMTHYSNDGITRFVERLHHDPVLAIACGFEFDSIPGEGTFYDFLHRFWLVRHQVRLYKNLILYVRKNLRPVRSCQRKNPVSWQNWLRKSWQVKPGKIDPKDFYKRFWWSAP